MKAILAVALCGLLAGCVHYRNAAPKGDNALAKVSSVSMFAGTYSDSGLSASSVGVSLAGFLLRYHDGRLDRGGQVRLSFPSDDTLKVEVRQNESVLKIQTMRLGVDYVFRDSMIVFESYRETGSTKSEAFPSVGSRRQRRAMWLTQDGDLVAEDVFSAAGVAMGFIPGAGYSRDAWRWSRVKTEN